MSDERWVRAGTSGTPLVALHTWRDEIPRYAALSAALGDRTVVSLRPPVPGRDPMPRRVDEWVEFHDAALADLALDPPYRLLGWSFGGVVALELARRFRARGTAVAFVGLIDTIRPVLRPLSDREFVWYHLGAAAALPPDQRRDYLRKKLSFLAVRRFPRAGAATQTAWRRLAGRPPVTSQAERKPTDPLMVSVHTAYLNYRGEPVSFPVSVYATGPSVVRAQEPALRWAPWLHGGFELVEVPGSHTSLFDVPNVDGLARALDHSLRLAESW